MGTDEDAKVLHEEQPETTLVGDCDCAVRLRGKRRKVRTLLKKAEASGIEVLEIRNGCGVVILSQAEFQALTKLCRARRMRGKLKCAQKELRRLQELGLSGGGKQ